MTDAWPDLGPWITAGYGSDCDGCGEEISDGDRIRSDGAGGWLCEDCGEDGDGEPGGTVHIG